MNKTLRISFALRISYKVNSIIFALKSLPLIKKLLPASLYASAGLKAFARVIAWIVEIVTVFIGKAIYLFSMVFFLLNTFDLPAERCFVHIFFFLTIIGGFMNTNAFDPTKDKYYAIFLLKMDAREYVLVGYIYFLAKNVVGFMPFTLLIGFIAGAPIWICVLMPFFVCAVKLIFLALIIRFRDISDSAPYNENLPTKIVWCGVLVCLGAAYVPLYFGYALPLWTFPALCVPAFAGAVVSAVKIWHFPDFRRVYKKLFDPASPALAGTAATKAAVKDTYLKKLNTDVAVTSGASGYKYFNQLFMRRHSRYLTQSAKRMALILLCIMLASAGACFVYPEAKLAVNTVILTRLPVFLFVMYFVNRGNVITQAMFLNCDHCMLTYRFYRQPRAILSLFTQRLKYLILINLLPALPIAAGLPALLYLTGGASSHFDYLLIAFSVFCMSVFFSVHSMVLYYLLQPYNVEAEKKSATFSIANAVTYMVCYALMMQNIPTEIFSVAAITFCILYIAVALLLAYRLAPKTFKLR